MRSKVRLTDQVRATLDKQMKNQINRSKVRSVDKKDRLKVGSTYQKIDQQFKI